VPRMFLGQPPWKRLEGWAEATRRLKAVHEARVKIVPQSLSTMNRFPEEMLGPQSVHCEMIICTR
jgi:hypothetical protein